MSGRFPPNTTQSTSPLFTVTCVPEGRLGHAGDCELSLKKTDDHSPDGEIPFNNQHMKCIF